MNSISSENKKLPKFIGKCFEGEKFKIEGINVWDYDWKSDYTPVEVFDPYNNKKIKFHLFSISAPQKKLRFVAGEFSSNVWGFYEAE